MCKYLTAWTVAGMMDGMPKHGADGHISYEPDQYLRDAVEPFIPLPLPDISP